MTRASKIRKLHGSAYRFGAHHPHCDRHRHHLIWVFGHPFCLGCTCMYSGVALGSFLAVSRNWADCSFFVWVCLHLVLILPTVLQPWIQHKTFKIMARLLLGISTGSYFVFSYTGVFLIRGFLGFWFYWRSLLDSKL
jgi:hypothetical protein